MTLTPTAEKTVWQLIDSRAFSFLELLELLPPVKEVIEARLKIEEAVMWAKKAITADKKLQMR